MRLETYLSTEPPASGKNARLSHSYENSGGAQCLTAPPPEEPSSLDSLKRSFDLSSFPQDFSAAPPERFSAGLRRRAAPQRVTMHALFPAQWVTAFTLGHHHARAFGKRGPAQSPAAATARGVPAESCEPSGRLGRPGQSPCDGGESLFHHAPTGSAAAISPAAAIAAAGWVMKLLTLLSIRFYQACISPMMPLACRFHPSCSAYAVEAVEKWGVWKGGRLALERLLRCRPWGRFGYDPVPEK